MNNIIELPGGCKTSRLYPRNQKINFYWDIVAFSAIISGFVGLIPLYMLHMSYHQSILLTLLQSLLSFLFMFLFPILFLFHIHLRAIFGFLLTVIAFISTVVIAADSGGGLSFLLYLNSAMNFALVVKFTEIEDKNFNSILNKNPQDIGV